MRMHCKVSQDALRISVSGFSRIASLIGSSASISADCSSVSASASAISGLASGVEMDVGSFKYSLSDSLISKSILLRFAKIKRLAVVVQDRWVAMPRACLLSTRLFRQVRSNGNIDVLAASREPQQNTESASATRLLHTANLEIYLPPTTISTIRPSACAAEPCQHLAEEELFRLGGT